ncbi:MAG TPA: hypothetical protein VLV16_03765 [Gemmatimonadales bacterium]|nr:hypothetical protein [Gemmatimonadales bacterium]
MKRNTTLLAVFVGSLSLACGGHSPPPPARVLVPARLDLKQYGRTGLVLFTVEKVKGAMDQVATQRFSEAVLEAQPGIEVLEVGSADSVRRRVGEATYGAATARALGAAFDVPVVFVGHLKMSSVTPQGGLSGLFQGHVDATVSAELSVALIATTSGGTLWRSSGVESRKIGGLSLVGGEPYVSAKDPNKAYSALVYDLVDYVTRDLRPTWQ